MIAVSRLTPREVAKQATDDPERFAMALLWVACTDDPFAEEFSHHLQQMLPGQKRRIRDLALMIAGACGEAE